MMTSGEMILLVNDIPDHVVAYQKRLSEHGFHVFVARSGREALELVHNTLPNCAVIDLRLPDMSGWDLCRCLKTLDNGRELPIIMLTPEVSRMCAADSAKAGCNAWLAHPTVAEDLVQTVRRVLDMETAEPGSPDDALLSIAECAACRSDRIRPTLRMGFIQYYCCKACGFCWRVEALEAIGAGRVGQRPPAQNPG